MGSELEGITNHINKVESEINSKFKGVVASHSSYETVIESALENKEEQKP